MMNQRSDTDRQLRHWMTDGPSMMPDRVLDIVAERISRQPQRRTWRLRGRPLVNSYLKLAAGIAAVAIIAVVGYRLLPGTTGAGAPTTAPTPSAQPTAGVTAAPSGGALRSGYPTTGILPAGSHKTRLFTPAFTFTVPAGWINDGDQPEYYSLFPDAPVNRAEFARTGNPAQGIVLGVHRSPWFVCESVENNAGATAADMVAAMVANEALATTGLVDVAIGGLTGKQFDVRLNPDWTGTCPSRPDDPPGFDLGDGRTRGLLLDVPGRGVLVMIVSSLRSADHDAFLGEAMPIIESFQFDLKQ